eukprot:1143264-Pelagomonas_calceolata.AAC.1
MVGIVRLEKENQKRACPAIQGSCPTLMFSQDELRFLEPIFFMSGTYAMQHQEVGLVSEGRHEAATKKNISKISGQRSAEMDRLAAEAAATRQELEATKTKLEAAIAR